MYYYHQIKIAYKLIVLYYIKSNLIIIYHIVSKDNFLKIYLQILINHKIIVTIFIKAEGIFSKFYCKYYIFI